MEQKPLKLILGVFTVLLLMLAGWFGIFYIKNKGENATDTAKNKQNTESQIKIADNAYMSRDSDSDGLLDWSETLIGTDPLNPDSDGDGTPDGEEVKQNRNPLKKGNDSITPTISGNSTGNPTGLTAQLAAGISGGYLLLKENGTTDKTQLTNMLTEQMSARLQTVPPLTDTYTLANIHTIPAGSFEIYAYGNAVGLIFKKDFSAVQKGEIVLLNEILNNESYSRLQEFSAYETAYKKAVSDLLALSAPQSFATMHLQLINNFANLSKINNSLAMFETDPAMGLVRLRDYQGEIERFKLIIQNIIAQLDNASISYTEKDNGFEIVLYYNELKNAGAI